MPKNLEIKARFESADRASSIAQRLGAHYSGVLQQIDTYYHVQCGRLKLREIINSHAELIYYLREEGSVERLSEFEIVVLPERTDLGRLLEHSLGTLAKVEKKRTLFFFGESRIHLDTVKDLGSFVEFEVPVHDDADSANERLRRLIDAFQIEPADFLKNSYLDLMLALKAEHADHRYESGHSIQSH